MKIRKLSTILSLVLSIVLVVTSITLAPAKAETIAKKSFAFPNIITVKNDVTSNFYYSDSYFTKSSFEYNPSLATMSCCMASSAIGATATTEAGQPDYSKFDSNLRDLLTKAGFTSFYSNEDYTTKPTKDSFGYAFAKRPIKVDGQDYTLIAINFRNAMYDKEWMSNFKLGSDGFHAGFKACGTKVLNELENYINANAITENVKLWIAGYSRGAGVANYLGYKLDSDHYIGDVSIDAKDLYVYSFGTPNTTTDMDYKKSKFKNIYNIISPYDMITQIAPEQWNWHRYGVEMTLPSTHDTQYEAKKARAQKFMDLMIKDTPVAADIVPGFKVNIDTTTYAINMEPDGTKDVSAVVDDLMTALAISIGSTDKFNELDPLVSAAVDNYFDLSEEQKDIFLGYVMEKVQEEGMLSIIADVSMQGDKLPDIMVDGLAEAGVTLDNPDEVKAAAKKLLYYVFSAVIGNFDTVPGAGATFYKNLYPIIGNHLNYTMLAWLQSFDSNYKLPSDGPKPAPPVKKPGKAKVTYAKKKSSKKVSIRLKKIKNAKGYQVAVYKSKKSKKALVKKTYKKTKFTITSKKFKKKKKLYVKARAYNFKTGKKKQYGKWSSWKKVKR